MIKCKDSNLIVEGKCKNIMLENCQNIKLIVENVLTSIEFVNCKKITLTVKSAYYLYPLYPFQCPLDLRGAQ